MAAPYGNQQSSVYPESYVGFDTITKQIEKKLVKRGFQFNVICVGKLYVVQARMEFVGG
jgi:septin 3/9/12